MELLKLENISKIYDNNTIVLDNINLKIRKGELIAIMGPSG